MIQPAMIVQSVAGWVVSVIDAAGYTGMFLLSFFENLAVPIPSEVVVPFSGFLASTGRFELVLVIVVTTAGNWIGSLTLFSLCRARGRRFLEKRGKYLLVSAEDLLRVDRWFVNYGPATVFWLRLVPVGRTLVSIPAGVSGMSFKKFAAYTLGGSLLWNVGLALLGYKAGENWGTVRDYFQHADAVVAVLLVVTFVLWLVRRRRERRQTR